MFVSSVDSGSGSPSSVVPEPFWHVHFRTVDVPLKTWLLSWQLHDHASDSAEPPEQSLHDQPYVPEVPPRGALAENAPRRTARGTVEEYASADSATRVATGRRQDAPCRATTRSRLRVLLE